VQRRCSLAGDRAAQTQLLSRVLPRALLVDDLEQADDAILVDERRHEEALVPVAAQDCGLRLVNVRIVDVDDGRDAFLEDATGQRVLAELVRPAVGQPLTGMVVIGQDVDDARALVELGDGAEVAVQKRRHAACDLCQQLGDVEPAGQGDGGVDEDVELALASELGGQVVRVADRAREVVDVAFVDPAVASRGPHAREEPGGRPASDGDR